MKILFVVNVDWFFLSHRLPIALEGINRGYDVYLATKDSGRKSEIESYGIHFIDIEFDRSSRNPFYEIAVFKKLCGLYNRYNFDIVHHVTIKPAIYGSIASRFSKSKPYVVNAISGLGYNFIGERKNLFQRILMLFMKFAFSYSKVNFIFQNPDDLQFYTKAGFLTSINHVLIKGAGVDQKEFIYTKPTDKSILQVLLPARMLFDKGIKEFCDAAKILEKKWKGKAVFILSGDIDSFNPAGANEEELKVLLNDGYIKWVGHQQNIQGMLIQSDIVCLPSYREGLPKALIEAMAVGRPIITTDAPGCRECVEDSFNGFLVPIKDSILLAERMDKLLSDKSLRLSMGLNSRAKMMKELALSTVIENTFNFYKKIRA